ncbi:MAG: hypothetical protein H0Z33_10945 [Bacillaceae bacterium]|nr:hypothetical protein [Bacillaceae bacterium]
MFFHGINWEYVIKQYPVLSPRASVWEKDAKQMADRKHLIEQFGFEPVHLLESCPPDYPASRCIRECLHYGDPVFAFQILPLPFWQLSRHERGVPALDLRTCLYIVTNREVYIPEIKTVFPKKPVIFLRNLPESN